MHYPGSSLLPAWSPGEWRRSLGDGCPEFREVIVAVGVGRLGRPGCLTYSEAFSILPSVVVVLGMSARGFLILLQQLPLLNILELKGENHHFFIHKVFHNFDFIKSAPT